jgi:hypothetical protein
MRTAEHEPTQAGRCDRVVAQHTRDVVGPLVSAVEQKCSL